jgi:hypothetical protein
MNPNKKKNYKTFSKRVTVKVEGKKAVNEGKFLDSNLEGEREER